MLVVEEDKRITWDEFFNHRAIKISMDSNCYLINDVEDLTANNFLLKSCITSLSDEQNKEI
jgi:serine/threonine-protein kinase ULK/ATG1